ncbi:hypothetical protein BU17DRAFT_40840, partial [Hysterangium stoloniferum]
FGIKKLSPGISPIIDIVAVHGLDGHREASWTTDNGSLWLRDFFPQDVPAARILTYGYDAYTPASSTQTLNHSLTSVNIEFQPDRYDRN